MTYLANVIRHLWVFLVAAEEKQFQRAAARLNIANSAVSRRIRRLEEELGVTLFERQPDGAHLTAEGEIFRADVDAVLKSLEAAVARTQRAKQGQVGSLRIGFIEMAARSPVMIDAIRKFQTSFTDVELKLMPMLSEDQDRAVKNGELDAGFYHRSAERSPELEYHILLVHRLLLALPKTSPHAKKRKVSLAHLGDESFVFPRRTQAPRVYEGLLTNFRLAGVMPRIIMEVGTSETMLTMASLGVGIGFVDNARRANLPDNIVLKPMVEELAPLELELAWRRDNNSPALKRFIETVMAVPVPAENKPPTPTGRSRG